MGVMGTPVEVSHVRGGCDIREGKFKCRVYENVETALYLQGELELAEMNCRRGDR